MPSTVKTGEELARAVAALGGYPAYVDEDGDVAGCVAQALMLGEGEKIALFFTGYADPHNANTLGRISDGPVTLDDEGTVRFARGYLTRDRAGKFAEASKAHEQDLAGEGITRAEERARLIRRHGGKMLGYPLS